jgi:hypothetical protein
VGKPRSLFLTYSRLFLAFKRLNTKDAQSSARRGLNVLIDAILTRRHEIRVSLLFANLLLFIILVTVGSLTPVPQPLAQELYNEILSIPIAAGSIFLHNAQICMVEVVPLLGAFVFLASAIGSGLSLSSISFIRGINPLATTWLLFNQYPHTWLEFLAYSMAATEGTMLLLMLIAADLGPLFRRELKILVLTIAAFSLLLALGSVFEMMAIFSGKLVVAATWVVSGVLLVAVVYYDAKKREMKLPNPLIPLVLVEVGTIAGFALPTLLIFAIYLWIEHVRHERTRDARKKATPTETSDAHL